MKRTHRWIGSLLLASAAVADGFAVRGPSTTATTTSRPLHLHAIIVKDASNNSIMRSTEPTNTIRRGGPPNSAAAEYSDASSSSSADGWWSTFGTPVGTAALLITGNTFGAGCLVLPDLARPAGFGPFAGLFAAAYALNLLSGLAIAQVAIVQHESSGNSDSEAADSNSNNNNNNSIPSSFKEFAQVNLGSTGGTLISALSLFVNSCVMSFDLSRVGIVGSQLIGSGDGDCAVAVTAVWAGLVATLLGVLNTQRLSQMASLCTTLLFASFVSLLIPGIPQIDLDQLMTTTAAVADGSVADPSNALTAAAPVILMAMIYQNIVPSVVKLLDFDRAKVTAALTLGSALPLGMYLSWCAVCLGAVGGGSPLDGIADNPMLAVFSLAALAGSSIGTGMSLSEEYETYGPADESSNNQDPETPTATTTTFAGSTVATAVSAPLAVAAYCGATGTDVTQILSLAGSLGSPILYGVVPALMAWRQLGQQQQDQQSAGSPILLPRASLGALGVLATGFVGGEGSHWLSQLELL